METNPRIISAVELADLRRERGEPLGQLPTVLKKSLRVEMSIPRSRSPRSQAAIKGRSRGWWNVINLPTKKRASARPI
jgi:hypothetical protein